jgi:hypothetical protein
VWRQPGGDGGRGGTLAGGWNYTMQLDDATTVHGAMTLGQDGAQVVGVMDLPIDGPADAATWRWNIAGTVDGNAAMLRSAVNDGCECPDVAPVDWACVVTSGLLDCGALTAVYAGP